MLAYEPYYSNSNMADLFTHHISMYTYILSTHNVAASSGYCADFPVLLFFNALILLDYSECFSFGYLSGYGVHKYKQNKIGYN